MDAFVGEIRLFAGNYAPVNWSMCFGQTVPISQYQVLFSLFGTIYGGDGVQTLGLPDLRGRVPIHFGTGTGLTPRLLGSASGTETVTVLTANLPQHNHAWMANTDLASLPSPNGNVLANVGAGNTLYETQATFDKPVAAPSDTLSMEGGNQAHANMMPYMALSFIVALQGEYPSRN
ncbi:phage tail protein [Azonexus caeni]|jgi:microcystin-dependent protein|uniref:phage tail protein n=1 Tax=Azonexus caeni TaxID=266126 RepID=UPI003A875656